MIGWMIFPGKDNELELNGSSQGIDLVYYVLGTLDFPCATFEEAILHIDYYEGCIIPHSWLCVS